MKIKPNHFTGHAGGFDFGLKIFLTSNDAEYNMNMSVRKIKKSYLSCTGYFASYKNKN